MPSPTSSLPLEPDLNFKRKGAPILSWYHPWFAKKTCGFEGLVRAKGLASATTVSSPGCPDPSISQHIVTCLSPQQWLHILRPPHLSLSKSLRGEQLPPHTSPSPTPSHALRTCSRAAVSLSFTIQTRDDKKDSLGQNDNQHQGRPFGLL